MNPTLAALRSIGSEFAWRLYLPITISVSAIITLLLIGGVWLTTLSGWWWILVAFFMFGSLIGAAILVVVGLIIRLVRPAQTKTQTKQVRVFVDKIQSLADVTGTPKIVILFRIVRDMTTRNTSGYIQTLYGDTASMRADFRNITDSFS